MLWYFVGIFILFLAVKEFLKSVKILQCYCQSGTFSGHGVYKFILRRIQTAFAFINTKNTHSKPSVHDDKFATIKLVSSTDRREHELL